VAFEHLKTNHRVDAVFSLETAQEFACRVTIDSAWWKWLLISIHSAVQGFMVLALEKGNALDAMKPKAKKAWLKAYKLNEQHPRGEMDNFMQLYDKVKSQAVCGYYESKPFTAGPTHDSSMKKLNELRNDFIHFMPAYRPVEREELASWCAIALDCLDVANFLGWESGCILWHDELSDRGKRAIDVLQATLGAVKRELGS
jgi:hypothetical protein